MAETANARAWTRMTEILAGCWFHRPLRSPRSTPRAAAAHRQCKTGSWPEFRSWRGSATRPRVRSERAPRPERERAPARVPGREGAPERLPGAATAAREGACAPRVEFQGQQAKDACPTPPAGSPCYYHFGVTGRLGLRGGGTFETAVTDESLGEATKQGTSLRCCEALLPLPRRGGEGWGEGEKSRGH